MVSITGISCSVLPCLGVIFGPMIARIILVIGEVVKAVVEWVLKNIIIPIVNFLHNWGIFELMAYIFCFEVIYEGSHLDVEE